MAAKHTMYTFRLHRVGVILVTLGVLLVATLLVVGGCMVGVWRAEDRVGASGGAVAGGAAAGGSSLARGRVPSVRSRSTPSVPSAGSAASRGARLAAGAAAGAAAGGAAGGAEGGGMSAGVMAPAPSAERFTLRVGAFNDKKDAKALVDTLTARGYTPSINEVQASTGATVYTVVVGTYTTRWEARGAAGELSRRERLEVVVVPVS